MSSILAAWLQGLTGLATFFVAWLTFNSQKKIKTLTDVVLQLQKQTKLLSDRYDLEQELSIPDRFPFFDITNFHPSDDNGNWAIEITNRGQFATGFFAINASKGVKGINVADYAQVETTGKLMLLGQSRPYSNRWSKTQFRFHFLL